MLNAQEIRLVIFDVDGVLTNGQLFYGDEGQEYKAFNSKDGHGIKMLMHTGVKVAIITARQSSVVTTRMHNLGVEHVYQGQSNKYLAYLDLLDKLDVQPHQVAYVGDDVIDLPVMTQVGLAMAVNDAVDFVKSNAHHILSLKGGEGAAREACELIMQAQGTLEPLLQSYLNPTRA
jgi:3-deoxy-D-manno-octulosonate 8-phosphate phosphatase (KDO 8-P phosphatase)